MKHLGKLLLPAYLIFLYTVVFTDNGIMPTKAHGQTDDRIEITIKIAKDVQDRMPIEVDSVFDVSVNKLFCWSAVAGVSDTIRIYHIWNYQGKQEARVPIKVTSMYFRAYTFQTIPKHKTGDWTVYVVDKENNVLGFSRFKVMPEQAVSSE